MIYVQSDVRMRIAGAGRVPDKPVVIVCSCVICAFRLVCHEPVCEYITLATRVRTTTGAPLTRRQKKMKRCTRTE